MQPAPSPPHAAPWDIPPEMLVRPWRDELRHLEHRECALLLDGHLRRLGRQEAVCRHVLGTLAAAFLRRRAQRTLGFARLGDCTRERFGISARELQSLAQVAMRLAVLPGLRRAFEAGALEWTHVRLLIDVATPADEARWIAVARGVTVRTLERRLRAAGGHACHGPVVAGIADEDGQTIEGEPVVRIRLACPRRLRALWRATVELARRMAGRPFARWEACEAIAAEGLASPVARRALGRSTLDGSSVMQAPDDRASGIAGTEDVSGNGPVATVERGPAERRTRAFSGADASSNGDGVSDGDGVGVVDAASTVDPAAAMQDEVASLVAGVDDLDAFALDARLRATLATMHRIHWQTGRLLRLVFDLRLYRWLGFSEATRYVKERLGIGIRTAQGLVAVERVTGRAPVLAAAYERGAISMLRALIIAPVLSETHEAAWVARATEVTVRRLGDEVAWALNHQDVRALCEPVAPPPAGTLVMPTDAQMRARFADETPEVVLNIPAPASVAALFETALAAFTSPGAPRWRGLEQLLEHVGAEWQAQPRHRDPIFERDGWRCAVPACSARRELHDHHIVFRSRCGGNERENRVAVCAAHHHHGLHGGGSVHAWGEAPDGIRWELGVRRNGPPLLALLGDRYVSAS